MLDKETLTIASIHVPVKRVKTLDPAKVTALAESMLEEGQKTPIRVRPRNTERGDGSSYVLIEGYHRLEALRALGEETIEAYIVQARPH